MKFEQILVIATFLTGIIWLIDAKFFRLKRELAGGKKEPILVEYSKSFFPVLIIVLLLRSFLAEPFRIPSGSMKPTLLEGDFILVNKFNYGIRLPVLGTKLIPVRIPKRGDVVVFRHKDNKDLIKRVVGLPGDHIIYKNKQLYINNEVVDREFESIAYDGAIEVQKFNEKLDNSPHDIFINLNWDASSKYKFDDTVVPENSYFVMGDNRDNSEDGRFWGFVSDEDLLGRATLTWLSWDSNRKDVRWTRFGKSIK